MKLNELIEDFLIKNNQFGIARLCKACAMSETTLRKVRSGYTPLPRRVYLIAKACGAKEEDALELARKAVRK